MCIRDSISAYHLTYEEDTPIYNMLKQHQIEEVDEDSSLQFFTPVSYTHLVILLACSFTGNVNNNAVLGSSVFLVVLGLISYIIINKTIAD